MAPTPVTVTQPPTTQRWRPSFGPDTDPNVKDAINRLYEMVYQISDQIQVIAQALKQLT